MKQWFFASGDAPFFFPENIADLSWWPQIIDYSRGFGQSRLPILWLEYPFQTLVKALSEIGIGWVASEKIIWLSGFVLTIWGAYALSYTLWKNKTLSILASLIYSTNTYALMMFGGGLIGQYIGYGIVPFAVLYWIRVTDFIDEGATKIQDILPIIVRGGMLCSLLCMIDIRLFILSLGIGIFLFALRCFEKPLQTRMIFRMICIGSGIGGIVFLTNLYWIIPAILSFGESKQVISDIYTGSGMAKFLSFADFPHTLSLLHPNWPENLFGKVYFLQPEFLILPILAFGTMLFLHESYKYHRHNGSYVVIFSLLSIIGAFMAKGANEPFGGLYLWLFDHVPGFILFRDPTKFYTAVALSYSILIPVAVLEILRAAHRVFRYRIVKPVGIVLFLLFWCFTIRQMLSGSLTGNFRPQRIPDSYSVMKSIVANDPVPYRTLWLPSRDLFAYSSPLHPILSGTDLFPTVAAGSMSGLIRSGKLQLILPQSGVRYIIVPADIEQRIFLDDYRYQPKLQSDIIDALSASGFPVVETADGLAVFENPYRDSSHEYTFFSQPTPTGIKIGTVVSAGAWIFLLFISVLSQNHHGNKRLS